MSDQIESITWRKVNETAAVDKECVVLARLIIDGFPSWPDPIANKSAALLWDEGSTFTSQKMFRLRTTKWWSPSIPKTFCARWFTCWKSRSDRYTSQCYISFLLARQSLSPCHNIRIHDLEQLMPLFCETFLSHWWYAFRTTSYQNDFCSYIVWGSSKVFWYVRWPLGIQISNFDNIIGVKLLNFSLIIIHRCIFETYVSLVFFL